MYALLESSPLADQDHSRPSKFSLISKLTRRNPHDGEGSGPLEFVQPPGIELVRLIHHPQHKLSLGGMDQLGNTTGLFDLLHDPVPAPPLSPLLLGFIFERALSTPYAYA